MIKDIDLDFSKALKCSVCNRPILTYKQVINTRSGLIVCGEKCKRSYQYKKMRGWAQ